MVATLAEAVLHAVAQEIHAEALVEVRAAVVADAVATKNLKQTNYESSFRNYTAKQKNTAHLSQEIFFGTIEQNSGRFQQ